VTSARTKIVIPLIGSVVLFLLAGAILYQTLFNKPPSFKMSQPAPDFQFQNIDGANVTLNDTDGKVRLVYFYYATCPDVCQPTTYLLYQVQEELKRHKGVYADKASILSITFDPERDTTEKLKEFAKTYNADLSGWYFLRGEEKYAIDVAYKYGVGVIKQPNGDIAHTNVILLVDKENNIRKYYNANDLKLDKMTIVKDMLALAKHK